MNQQKFIIHGGRALKGKIMVSGSKNAALPILCAALLPDSPSTFENVPDIEDIRSLLEMFEDLGVRVEKNGNTVLLDPKNLRKKEPKKNLVCRMRASVLIAAPLLMRFGEIDMEFPGGCVLGKRPLSAHTFVFRKFGAEIQEEEMALKVRMPSESNGDSAKFSGVHSGGATKDSSKTSRIIVMPEASVTATENALMLAAATTGRTEIRLAACEPHVQDLCHFLNKIGAKITGIGTHTLVIEGAQKLHGARHRIIGDYLEVGTFALAAAMTRGEIEISGFPMHHLDSFWQKCEEAGIPFETSCDDIIHIRKVEAIQPIANLKTAVHPSFPTDLQAPFTVLLTQAQGVSKIFETLFDGRLSYLFELEKMGARFEMLNPHQAIIIGKTSLKGAEINSCDIRAGAGMVIAALGAHGVSTISNILYIDRGYENLEQKFRSLGADIVREGAKSGAVNATGVVKDATVTQIAADFQNTTSTVPSRSVRRIAVPVRESLESVSS